MFAFAGKEAVDGGVKRLGEVLSGIDPTKLNESITKLGEKIPVLGILVKGYNAMSNEEQAEFVKNCMLAGAAMAAKSGGKVSF